MSAEKLGILIIVSTEIISKSLSGIILLKPQRFNDLRGFFSEIWSQQNLSEVGIDINFLQENHSFSHNAGTIRGLHSQSPPHAQTKLVRCGKGRFFDVAVDIRIGSPTYGQWVGEELSFENGKQLLIPVGFLHGFATLEPNTEIIYKCSEYYAPGFEYSVRFDDPDINNDWGIRYEDAVLSDKDANAPFLKDLSSPFSYE